MPRPPHCKLYFLYTVISLACKFPVQESFCGQRGGFTSVPLMKGRYLEKRRHFVTAGFLHLCLWFFLQYREKPWPRYTRTAEYAVFEMKEGKGKELRRSRWLSVLVYQNFKILNLSESKHVLVMEFLMSLWICVCFRVMFSLNNVKKMPMKSPKAQNDAFGLSVLSDIFIFISWWYEMGFKECIFLRNCPWVLLYIWSSCLYAFLCIIWSVTVLFIRP